MPIEERSAADGNVELPPRLGAGGQPDVDEGYAREYDSDYGAEYDSDFSADYGADFSADILTPDGGEDSPDLPS